MIKRISAGFAVAALMISMSAVSASAAAPAKHAKIQPAKHAKVVPLKIGKGGTTNGGNKGPKKIAKKHAKVAPAKIGKGKPHNPDKVAK